MLSSNWGAEGGHLVLTNEGRDDRRPAKFRYTIAATETVIRITKEVKFLDDDSAEYFIRNQYNYERLDAMNTSAPDYGSTKLEDAG